METNLPAPLVAMAKRLHVDPIELRNIIVSTVMPSGATNEQFISFLAVANEYGLNPMTREVYAFPSKGGGIQPIVSIDGWLKIINSHPQFDGMIFQDTTDEDGNLIAITCRIFRKDRTHPTEATEYMVECRRNTEPWQKWPRRMLRHKATIQAARYAFGLAGIIDPDEAERIQDAEGTKIVNEPQQALQQAQERPQLSYYPEEKFKSFLPKWQQLIEAGKSAEQIIQMVSTKYKLTEEQKQAIRMLEPKQEDWVIDAETGEVSL